MIKLSYHDRAQRGRMALPFSGPDPALVFSTILIVAMAAAIALIASSSIKVADRAACARIGLAFCRPSFTAQACRRLMR
jgi:hypothetical protein